MTDRDFASVVHGSGPRLLRFAVLLSGHRSDAEDMLQEALIRAYPAGTESATSNRRRTSAGRWPTV